MYYILIITSKVNEWMKGGKLFDLGNVITKSTTGDGIPRTQR
jgi:hypothetical protein